MIIMKTNGLIYLIWLKNDIIMHQLGNKLFVIGGHKILSSELFDSFTRKFTLLLSIYSKAFHHSTVQAIGVCLIL